MSVTQKEIVHVLRVAECFDLADSIEREGIEPPEGYEIVPSEPTPEMLEAGNVVLIRIKEDPTPSVFNRAFYCYKAMLKASKDVK